MYVVELIFRPAYEQSSDGQGQLLVDVHQQLRVKAGVLRTGIRWGEGEGEGEREREREREGERGREGLDPFSKERALGVGWLAGGLRGAPGNSMGLQETAGDCQV